MNLRVTDPSETPGKRFDAQLAALAAAREEGLIDGIGLSNISRRHLLRAVAQTEIVCVQNLFNLADQHSADVLAECAARDVAFVIGGAYGLDDVVRRASSRSIQLAPWTLPHELARLVLAEQLYRAGTIARGEPYHK